MRNYIIKNAIIVNEGRKMNGDVLIKDGRIDKIGTSIETPNGVTEINAEGMYLIPGAIDDQVHFREPGLTHKASIYTESKAAVAGGVTSFMEMPNTVPPVFNQTLLEDKYQIGAQNALANYSFFMGTSQDNWEEVLRTNEKKNEVCGVKIFMGSSTGNLLVDNPLVLEKIFEGSELLIATHCEEEGIIKKNKAALEAVKSILEPSDHPIIRNEEACFESSFKAIQLAKKFNSRLHILHISTAKELQLFSNMLPLADKRITSEVCVHHLHFTADDYATKGNLIKCNPAIKAPENKAALWEGLLNDQLDVIATDHAPHAGHTKEQTLDTAPPGMLGLETALGVVNTAVTLSPQKIAALMSWNPAVIANISDHQGRPIAVGEPAHIAVWDTTTVWSVSRDELASRSTNTPYHGMELRGRVRHTIYNGQLVVQEGKALA